MTMTTKLWFRRAALSAGALFLLVLLAVPAVHLYGSSQYDQALSKAGELTLDPAAFEMPEIPDHENAAVWIEAGAGSMILSPEDVELRADLNMNGPARTWEPGQLEAARSLLDRYSGGLETVHRVAALEASSYKIRYRDGLKAEIPDLMAILNSARLLFLEVRVAEIEGDELGTLSALASLSRIAETLEEESTLITALVGIACERMLLVSMGEVVGSSQAWAGQPEFLNELEGILPTQGRVEMLGRTMDAWTAIMLAHGPLANGEEGAAPTAEKPFFLEPFGTLTRAEVLRARDHIAGLMDVPFGRSPELFERPAEPSSLTPHKKAVFEDEWGFVKALARAQSIAAQRQLVRAAIEVRRLAHSSGSYDAERPTIAELQTADPFTDRRLVYVLEEDGSVKIALDDATPLLEKTILASAARSVVPILLPPLGS